MKKRAIVTAANRLEHIIAKQIASLPRWKQDKVLRNMKEWVKREESEKRKWN